jgi:hypothetical protein
MNTTMLKMGTDTTTIRVTAAYLRAWLYDQIPPKVEGIAPDASIHLIEAVTTQTKIGWAQWFQGRICKKWGEICNDDICKPNIVASRPYALKWGQTIILETWKFVLDSWYIRNSQEHDNQGGPIRRQKEKIIDEIMWRKEKFEAKESSWTDLSK